MRFYAGTPLVASNGHRLGTLCFADPAPHAFDAERCAILNNMAELCVRELERHSAARRRASGEGGAVRVPSPQNPEYPNQPPARAPQPAASLPLLSMRQTVSGPQRLCICRCTCCTSQYPVYVRTDALDSYAGLLMWAGWWVTECALCASFWVPEANWARW